MPSVFDVILGKLRSSDLGTPGVDAPAILNGTAVPTTEGENGDFYIRLDTGIAEFYGPKAAGVWPAGIDLVGPPGADGADGDDGAPGATGATGATGPSGLGELIVSTTLGAAATSVTLAIPAGNQSWRRFRIEVNGKVKAGTTAIGISLYVNGDTTATNYYTNILQTLYSGLYSAHDQNNSQLGSNTYEDGYASRPGAGFELIVECWRNAAGYFAFSGRKTQLGWGFEDFAGGKGSATIASVTELRLVSTEALGFDSGTIVKVYGLA